MPAILDLGAVLMAQGTYASSQSFPPLLAYPRHLATSFVTINMLTPPVASATFTLAVASTEAGVYSTINTYTWPAGLAGSRQVAIGGVNRSLAQMLNTTSIWLRLSVTTTGALTGSAWLSKPADGGPGLGSRAYSLDNLNAI